MWKSVLQGCLIVLLLMVAPLQAQAFENGNNVAVENPDSCQQSAPLIQQLYPNPFTSKLVLNYTIRQAEEITIELYDHDRRLDTLYQGYRDPGNYTVEWKNNNIESGVYYCHFHIGSQFAIHPIAIMK